MFSSGSSAAVASDKDIIERAKSYQTLVGSHPELDVRRKYRGIQKSSTGPWLNSKSPEQLKKALDQRKKARDIEHDWTQQQIERLKEEQSRLAEEELKLRKAKERWGSPLGDISKPGTPTDGPLKSSEDFSKREDDSRKYKKDLHENKTVVTEQSLPSWQAPDYFMMRELLVELINEVVDKAEETSFQVHSDTLELLMKAAQHDRATDRRLLKQEKTAILLTGEILEEFVHDFLFGISEEFIHRERYVRWQEENIVISSAEAVAMESLDGMDRADSAYDLVTGTYRQMVRERAVKRPAVWLHTQPFLIEGSENLDETSSLDPDTTQLDFLSLRPLVKFEGSPALKIYRDKEVECWTHFSIEVTMLNLHKKVGGVSSAAVSVNQQQLAVGTVKGDVITYSLMQASPQVVRYIRNTGTAADPITSLSWSLDGNRIISLNHSGSLQVWSTYPGGRSTTDAKELDLVNIYTKTIPPQLTLLLAMDSLEQDFNFQEGPLAESGAQKEIGVPILAAFHPSSTLLATQNSFVAGLQSGDVLKCNVELGVSAQDTEEVLPEQPVNVHLPLIPSSSKDLLGQDIGGELFRGHRSPLVFMGFIQNFEDMVTVDTSGNIFVWKYDKNNLSHFGWFEPERKYNLLLAERAYERVETEEKVVYFSDNSAAELRKKKGNELAKIKKRWEQKRAAAQRNMERLSFRDIFIREVDSKANRVMTITEPLLVEERGSHFHGLIQEMSTKKLLEHFSQMYRVVKNHCTRIIDCQLNPDGTELIFCLLFPPFYPKEPHISFITVYLRPEVRVQKKRIDILLYESEYNRCLREDVCSFSVSQVSDASKSSYLFVTLIGGLLIYSRNTGSLLVSTRDNDKPLTAIGSNKTLPRINNSSWLKLSHCAGHVQAVVYSQQEAAITILHVIDRNSAKRRRLLHKAYKLWRNGPSDVPLELTTQRAQYMLDRDHYHHAELYLYRLVLQLMDRAMQEVDGEFGREELESNMTSDRIAAINYVIGKQDQPGHTGQNG